MTSIAHPVTRVARCGCTYSAPSAVGRPRNYGDCECGDGGAKRQAQRDTSRYSVANKANSAARWSKVDRAEACLACGGPLPEGKWSSYCSRLCVGRVSYQRRKDRVNGEKRLKSQAAREEVTKTCPQCDADFSPQRTMSQIYCSKVCGRRAARISKSKTCGEADCDRPVSARGMCQMHWRRWARATGREKAPEWGDRRKANHHKRRALKKKLPAADIRPRDVYERDSWACGLCGGGIDPDVAWPDPLSASLDHILPLSKGGHHVPENVQAAHLSCNVRKGNRVEVDAMSA